MRPRTITSLVVLFLAAVIIGACGDGGTDITADGQSETIDDSGTVDDSGTTDDGTERPIDRQLLQSGTWELRFGGGPSGEVPVVDGWPITITFASDTLGGTAACNDYGATYRIEGHQLMISGVGSNDAGCAEEVLASEAAFFEALADVDGIDLVGSGDPASAQLALSGMGTELIFAWTPPAPTGELIGRLWLLEALGQDGRLTPAQGDPATLRLDADGGMVGSTGCRDLVGRYLTSGREVVLNELGAEGDCPSSLQAQDSLVISVLGDGFVATVDGDRLELVSSGGEGLRYRAITEDELAELPTGAAPTDAELLADIEWAFAGGDSPDGPITDPRTIDAEAAITIVFGLDGYEGVAACRRYGGEADIGESLWTFTLGAPTAEEEGCGDELEPIIAAYLAALPQMTEGGVEADGERLVMNGNQIELHFERLG